MFVGGGVGWRKVHAHRDERANGDRQKDKQEADPIFYLIIENILSIFFYPSLTDFSLHPDTSTYVNHKEIEAFLTLFAFDFFSCKN